MKIKLFLFALLLVAVSVVAAIVSAQRNPDERPISGDFKITVRQTISGQNMQSTAMIKGARERTETSMNVPGMPAGMSPTQVTITQCDMRRTIQLNDHARKYMITPMDSDDSSSGGSESAASSTGAPTRRGGVVTASVNTIDTGERKEMFGFTARHLKRTTTMDASPDACNQQKMRVETDGWYINLEYGLSCPANRPSQTGSPGREGCRDRYVFHNTGPANLGYPLQETTTIFGPEYGSTGYSITKEVVELSRQTLDASLFDIPVGYTEAHSQQELHPRPSLAELQEMAREQQRESKNGNRTSNSGGQTYGLVRIGVVDFNNKTKTSVSTDELRQQLIAALKTNGVEAIALNASSPGEAAMEAQAKQCNYILFTDISTLKAASAGKKLGGLLGRATGVGSSDAAKSEAKFDFKLLATGNAAPVAQSSASAKEDAQDATIAEAIQSEARAVVSAIRP